MTNEVRYGLASTFVIKCPFCGKSNQVKTSGQHRSGKCGPPAFDINTRVVLGCLHAGIGETFISQSVDRAKSQTNKNIETVLLGHNSSIFDTPVLLRNSGTHFTERLQKMDICFADSLTLFKTLIRKKMPCLQNSDGTFPKPNQSSLYNFLFAKSFEAHDALEDVLALRKIIVESRLELSLKTIIENSGVVSAVHAAKDVKYLDHRHLLMQSFKDSLYHPQYPKKNMVKKKKPVVGCHLTI